MNNLVKNNKEEYITIIDYVKTNFDSFSKSAFNKIDGLIFSQLSYLDFTEVVPLLDDEKPWTTISSLYKAEKFDNMLSKTFYDTQNKELLCALCASPRYRDVLINYYTNKIDVKTEEQFCAVTFKLPTGKLLVTYRGTDPTIIGWKEDMNMSYLFPVPSQISSVNYLEKISEKTSEKMYILGHSKGGNLAVYSMIHSKKEVRDRVEYVYDYDGPGFHIDAYKDLSKEEIENKIVKIMPEGSIVGALFESVGTVDIIKSNKITLMQHMSYHWEISGNEFISSDTTTNKIKYMDKALNTWVYNLNLEQRKLLVETIFSIINTSDVTNISEIAPYLIKKREIVKQKIKSLDKETSVCVKEIIRGLVKISFKSVFASDEIISKGLETLEN